MSAVSEISGDKVLLMLSGGRDSFLSACKILEDEHNYHLLMVTYDNGCLCELENVKTVADKIIRKYGEDRVEYLGVYKTITVARAFFDPYFNMKPAEQQEKYSGMTPSQFHCLVCRTSMYVYSVWLAQTYRADMIAEGARKCQEFVIELPGMAKDRYPKMLKELGLQLLLPVYDIEDDAERNEELARRFFNHRTYEPKCMIGWPVKGSVDQSVIDGVHAYFDDVILPIIKQKNFFSEAERKNNVDYYFDRKRNIM